MEGNEKSNWLCDTYYASSYYTMEGKVGSML
jgi:hypothetical protein